jgi:hypothetical protein
VGTPEEGGSPRIPGPSDDQLHLLRRRAAEVRQAAAEARERAHLARQVVDEALERLAVRRASAAGQRESAAKSREAANEWLQHVTRELERVAGHLAYTHDEHIRRLTEHKARSDERDLLYGDRAQAADDPLRR